MDLANAVSFFKSFSGNNSKYDKEVMYDLIKKNILYFSFSETDLDNAFGKKKNCFSRFRTNSTSGDRKSHLKYKGSKSKEEIEKLFLRFELDKEYIYDELNIRQLMSIYLLDNEKNKNVEKLKEQGGLLIGLKGDEMSILQKKSILNTEKISTSKIQKDWSIFKEYALPLTDIIVIDQYLLSYSETAIRDNYGKIFHNLTEKTKVNHINFVLLYNSKCGKLIAPQRMGILIQEEVNNECRFTFIDTDKYHDRYIITNYKYFHSGPGFYLFKDDGESGSKLGIFSICNSDDDYFPGFIDELREKVSEELSENPEIKRITGGDYESNFFRDEFKKIKGE